MNVKETARRQLVRIADLAAQQLGSSQTPSEGWIATLRKALGMSGAEVAARMDVSRNAVYQAERNERYWRNNDQSDAKAGRGYGWPVRLRHHP